MRVPLFKRIFAFLIISFLLVPAALAIISPQPSNLDGLNFYNIKNYKDINSTNANFVYQTATDILVRNTVNLSRAADQQQITRINFKKTNYSSNADYQGISWFTENNTQQTVDMIAHKYNSAGIVHDHFSIYTTGSSPSASGNPMRKRVDIPINTNTSTVWWQNSFMRLSNIENPAQYPDNYTIFCLGHSCQYAFDYNQSALSGRIFTSGGWKLILDNSLIEVNSKIDMQGNNLARVSVINGSTHLQLRPGNSASDIIIEDELGNKAFQFDNSQDQIEIVYPIRGNNSVADIQYLNDIDLQGNSLKNNFIEKPSSDSNRTVYIPFTDSTATDMDGNTVNSSQMNYGKARLGNGGIFNGSGYLSIGDTASLDLLSGYTIEMWINRTVSATTGYLMHKESGSGAKGGYTIISANTNKITTSIRNVSSSVVTITSSSTIITNNSYHIAVTYDNATTNLSLYVNGILENSSITNITNSATITNLGIGATAAGATFFTGTIDEIMIYEFAKTGAEIQSDYSKSSESYGLKNLWSRNLNYPAACPAGSYITALDDSTTCTAISSIPNNVSVGTSNNAYFIIGKNTTTMTCGTSNEGSIYYNNVSKKHYGCNSTDWNALW